MVFNIYITTLMDQIGYSDLVQEDGTSVVLGSMLQILAVTLSGKESVVIVHPTICAISKVLF